MKVLLKIKKKSEPATITDWSRLENLFCELQDNFIKPIKSSHRKKIKSKDNRGTDTAQGIGDSMTDKTLCVYGRRRYGMWKNVKRREGSPRAKM